jgi:hypothetical protein
MTIDADFVVVAAWSDDDSFAAEYERHRVQSIRGGGRAA